MEQITEERMQDRKRRAEWRERNREHINEYNREWYAEHKEARSESQRRWKEKNKEHIRAYMREYAKRVKEKKAASPEA